MFNVGQGDNILIEFKDNSAAVIDFYFDESLGHLTVPALAYVRAVGINKIRFVHLSHYDFDHLKGLPDFLSGCASSGIVVDRIILPGMPDQTSFESRFKSALKKEFGRIVRVDSGQEGVDDVFIAEYISKLREYNSILDKVEVSLKKMRLTKEYAVGIQDLRKKGDDCRLIVFLPSPGKVTSVFGRFNAYVARLIGTAAYKSQGVAVAERNPAYVNKNEISTCLKLQVHGKKLQSALFTGDCLKPDLERMLHEFSGKGVYDDFGPIGSGFVKCSHHGAKSSSSELIWEHFLEDSRQMRVAISAGLERYPDPETLKHIEHGAKSKSGTLEVYSTNKDLGFDESLEKVDLRQKGLFLTDNVDTGEDYMPVSNGTFAGLEFWLDEENTKRALWKA